jgi:hypothetical protein
LNFGIVNFGKNYLIMQTASFNGFIKALIYFFAFYYIFKFLAKLFLPLLIKKVVEKASTNFQKQQQNSYNGSWNKTVNNDEIIIYETKVKNPRETKKVGEYVDYEELE